MGLSIYRRKRTFDRTPEPRGRKARGQGHAFVVQKHAARRLHYDFRLELDGVLKSWAVTRGPSLVPGEKRLAVHVEDHPVAYGGFEGIIPKGQYGGGTVMLWDRGTWAPDGDPHRGLKKGHLSFTLQGKKLKGHWHLVRMHGHGKERQEPWLLIKGQDDAARPASAADILEEAPDSVASGRSIAEIASARSRVWQSNSGAAAQARATRKAGRGGGRATKSVEPDPVRASGRKRREHGDAPLPDFVPPMLATLSMRAPEAGDWHHEVKFDGYRIQARLDHGKVRLLTRKGIDWTARFPSIAGAVAGLPAETALIDGELVVEDAEGLSSFSTLQADLKAGRRDRFVYYVFDLLHRDGRDLRNEPLRTRQTALADLVRKQGRGPVRLSEPFAYAGALVLRQACRMRLEGIVSKRADAPYRSARSPDWIKTKCNARQELVVVGFAESTVEKRAIGALLVGYYQDGELTYAGRVGTGYSRTVARDLWKRLAALQRPTSPFAKTPAQERRRKMHWVEPGTVIEVDFIGWTGDGLVRHAAFKGLREDKPAREVVRETVARPARGGRPRPATRERMQQVAAPRRAAAAKRGAGVAKASGVQPRAAKTRVARSALEKSGGTAAGNSARRRTEASAEHHGVRLTHPQRVYWDDLGITKERLATYYESVWDWMAPHVVDRPLALVRCPDGASGHCFFQKHVSAGLDDERLVRVPDGRENFIAVRDLPGVLALVQAGVLEIHPWGAKIDDLNACDRLIFDLDPGDGVAWEQLAAAARDVRERLAGVKLESFVKLTGGKGIHVMVPIAPTPWDQAKTFAHTLALAMAKDAPGQYLAKMTKRLRRGRIFVDYLRNGRGATAVAAYSTRARPGAAISAPLSWSELGRTRGGSMYNVESMLSRLQRLRNDPWAEVGRIRQKLPNT